MAIKSLMQMFLDAGYPKEEMYNHESDLYVFVTPLTTKVIEEWCKAYGYNKMFVEKGSPFFETFTDSITGKLMYSIAFQYLPWWSEKSVEE